MSITTKRGDEGMTDLLFGGKLSKIDPQVEALGAVDELNAMMGFARLMMDGESVRVADRIQSWLVTLMGELAMPAGKNDAYDQAGFDRIGSGQIEEIEQWSLDFEGGELFRGWLRPGADGGEVASRLHLARTVARRAERRVWEVTDEVASGDVRIFLNRLSDLLWLMARSAEDQNE